MTKHAQYVVARTGLEPANKYLPSWLLQPLTRAFEEFGKSLNPI